MSDIGNFDVAVVGAGVVGLCASILLVQRGYRVTLIDPVLDVPELPESFDLRTYALTPASMRVLTHMGLREALRNDRIADFVGMRVWAAKSAVTIDFSAAALGRECLGHIVEHANLMRALHRGLSGCDQLKQCAARVQRLDSGADDIRLSLDTGDCVRASLVLGCDGMNSQLRKLMSIESNISSYAQHAVVCNVQTEHAHGGIARQRFLTNGPLAFLPLAEKRSSAVVWTTTPDEAARAAGTSEIAFQRMLRYAFDDVLGSVIASSERLVLPLQKLHVGRYCAGRTVLLGDAAHVIHPLAGQGLNLGLMDVAALTQSLGSYEELTLKYPTAALRRFERMRRSENLAMLNLTDRLNQLFRTEKFWITRVRSVGMAALDRATPLKQWMMLRAMGEVGDVPDIAAPDVALR